MCLTKNSFITKGFAGLFLFLCALIFSPSIARASIAVLQAPSPVISGTQKILVILVDFQDDHERYFDMDQLKASLQEMEHFFDEVSYHKFQVKVTKIAGYYTLPIAVGDRKTCPDGDEVVDGAIKAADPDVFFPDYDRIVFIHPFLDACGFSGTSLGTIPINTADGPVNIGVVHINGTEAREVISHELGHQIGLQHASALKCATAVSIDYNCIGNSNTTWEYGDVFDTMAQGIGHFNAVYKKLLGWLSPANIRTLTSPTDSGTYILQSLELLTTKLQALRIDLKNGASYVLEYRQPIGFDKNSDNPDLVFDGLQIRYIVRDRTTGAVKSHLLDMTPSSSAYFRDAALTLGKTFVSPFDAPNPKVAITVKDITHSAITIDVQIHDPDHQHLPPKTPTGLKATPISTGVALSWNPSDMNGGFYTIMPMVRLDKVTITRTSPTNTFVDQDQGDTAYLYAVRAVDGEGYSSEISSPVLATRFWFLPIAPGSPVIAQDICELRKGINLLSKLLQGTGISSWADKSVCVCRGTPLSLIDKDVCSPKDSTSVRPDHIQELRKNLEYVLQGLRLPIPTYKNQNLEAQPIRGIDVKELEDAINPSNIGMLGDVDNDGVITQKDARAAFDLFFATPGSIISRQRLRADTNRNGKITPADTQCILQRVLGKPSCLD